MGVDQCWCFENFFYNIVFFGLTIWQTRATAIAFVAADVVGTKIETWPSVCRRGVVTDRADPHNWPQRTVGWTHVHGNSFACELVHMVTATTGYRGCGLRRPAGRSAAAVLLLALCLPPLLLHQGQPAEIRQVAKRKSHWKANVIRNHLKNHKSLEGMARLVDGQSEYEGMITNIKKQQKRTNPRAVITR